jgi:hypothetical protein
VLPAVTPDRATDFALGASDLDQTAFGPGARRRAQRDPPQR